MMRFTRAAVATALPLLLVAGAVFVLLASTGVPENASTTALPQTEDDAEATVADDAVTTTSLAGVTRLLESLRADTEQAEGTPVADQRVVLTRDPFDPVVVDDPGDGLPSDGGDGDGGNGDGGDGNGDGGDGDGGDGDGGDGNGDGGDGNGDDGCSGDESETVCDGRVVTVDGVTSTEADVVVDGTIFTVGVGDEFATSFRVLALDPPCVTMLYGDEAFTLCTGITVLK